MKVVNRVMQRQIIRAMVIGASVGLLGVAMFLGILQANSHLATKEQNSDVTQQTKDTTTTPVAGEMKNATSFYASQAGVYSNYESASAFVAEQPALKESAIVEVEGKYYVWTSMVMEESQLLLVDNPKTFKKAFYVSGESCQEATMVEVPKALAEKNAAKLKFNEDLKDSTLPTDWQSIGKAASTISSNFDVIRLQMFAHYKAKNPCLQVKF
ncbi:hypothetical protein [Lysinibacillus piscis]|uniref:Uncharacterized protein n=1 Tax=Lysinibacillus piscis TaxID=2518931 RepID=A0ABQ5NJG0_9BACI|nr:hypothetical protein [Lysinibacillus sp. KH24]GLC88424.1 hypothetical protein LYSBPC_15510 [Lysinibacillus sp. KH24]